MVSSSSFSALSHPSFQILYTNLDFCEKPSNLHNRVQIKSYRRPAAVVVSSSSCQRSSPSPSRRVLLHGSVSLAASAAILLCSGPAEAGFLSGSTGMESIPGPELPQVDFLKRFNEENQKKYAENDARFKSTPLLKGLLEKSKLNKERNSKEIQDKYCIRGAEWGIGDCSAEGMSPDEKDKFIAMLKEKAGVKD
ncbi:uncharacterized protein Pyn_27918 [Prunus yedoensis var. nudiflora]|uniref:Uncharacterized protein n=1 Tax=Prunus yedoensis var. nudiflora TaxID=2094558 RepID=A0A314Y015_PRUYE|nr:uncharacterized protein Pyn_27918 [Prunus yedoensis var. nudiflora]